MNNSLWNSVHFLLDYGVMITPLSCHKLTHEASVSLISYQGAAAMGWDLKLSSHKAVPAHCSEVTHCQ